MVDFKPLWEGPGVVPGPGLPLAVGAWVSCSIHAASSYLELVVSVALSICSVFQPLAPFCLDLQTDFRTNGCRTINLDSPTSTECNSLNRPVSTGNSKIVTNPLLYVLMRPHQQLDDNWNDSVFAKWCVVGWRQGQVADQSHDGFDHWPAAWRLK